MKIKNFFRRVALLIILSIASILCEIHAANTSPNYLCFTADEANAKVALNKCGNPNPVSLKYSTDGSTWKNYVPSTTGDIILAKKGDKVWFRATSTNSTFSTSERGYYNFSLSKKVAASGNVMSLLDASCRQTTVPTYAFAWLFELCSTLTTAPELPATQLSPSCYDAMFANCESLTKAPALPATQLADGCYAHMFGFCTSLTEAPALPATELKPDCYNNMFVGCESLVVAPALPATKLAESCYVAMFTSCTSLTDVPCLPATELKNHCYCDMFYGCSSLNKVSANFSNWESSVDATLYWLDKTANEGTFICPNNLSEKRGGSYIPAGWTVVHPDYLCFTAEEANAKVALKKQGNPGPVSLKYSQNRTTWWDYEPGTTGDITLAKKGDKVWFRATSTNKTFSKDVSNYYYFSLTNEVAASGNVMSLFDASCQQINVPNYAFANLFKNCNKLTSAPELPSTQLADYCYYNMFSNCKSLSEAPELPATQLEAFCYDHMFYNCSSLITVPDLSATQLAEFCYNNMFRDCSSLTDAPFVLPATQLTQGCYAYMFCNCSSLTAAPELPASQLAEECYYNMFSNCKSLSEAPELPATQLEKNCYEDMFRNCLSLTTAPELPATQLADYCYQNMFYNCSSLVQGPDTLPAKQLDYCCYASMFNCCTSLITAPVMLAEQLAEWCCCCMFCSCESLTEAPELPATQLAEYCYESMFYDCSALIKAPKTLPAIRLAEACYEGMFCNCTSLTEAPVLPATELEQDCYMDMFRGCSSLNKMEVGFSDWQSNKWATDCWLEGVAQEGVFLCPDELPQLRGESNIPDGWSVNLPDYLCFTAEESDAKVALRKCNNPAIKDSLPHDISLKYSTDRIHWHKYEPGQTGEITLENIGDKVWFRADSINKKFSKPHWACYQFSLKNKIAASGNVMSLLDSTCQQNYVPYACFEHLFDSCSTLVSAPDILPATELNTTCYYMMFAHCTSLLKAPELPADTLKQWCYHRMFEGCSSLLESPMLPAEQLVADCYDYMFRDCTSLRKVTVNFNNWANFNHTTDWLKNVAREGDFYAPEGLPVPVRNSTSGYPYGWNRINLSSEFNAANVRPNFQNEPEEEEVSSIAEQPIVATKEDKSYSLSGQRTTNKQGLIIKNGKLLLVK